MKDLIEIPFFTRRKKNVYKQLIPLKIFQTWKIRYVSPKMYKNILKNMEMNPEYDYYFFGDEECKVYLQKNYGKEYLDAFEDLIPGAFKADLWRYAILAKEGGVYIDLDIDLKVPLREIIKENESFVSVKDRVKESFGNECSIYQAFIATIPNFIFLKETLKLTLDNVKNKYNGINSLDITGPVLMGRIICKLLGKNKINVGDFNFNDLNCNFLVYHNNHIYDKNKIIFNPKLDDYKDDTNYHLLFDQSSIYHSQRNYYLTRNYYLKIFFIIFLILVILKLKVL